MLTIRCIYFIHNLSASSQEICLNMDFSRSLPPPYQLSFRYPLWWNITRAYSFNDANKGAVTIISSADLDFRKHAKSNKLSDRFDVCWEVTWRTPIVTSCALCLSCCVIIVPLQTKDATLYWMCTMKLNCVEVYSFVCFVLELRKICLTLFCVCPAECSAAVHIEHSGLVMDVFTSSVNHEDQRLLPLITPVVSLFQLPRNISKYRLNTGLI